jgi:hypothetical protein
VVVHEGVRKGSEAGHRHALSMAFMQPRLESSRTARSVSSPTRSPIRHISVVRALPGISYQEMLGHLLSTDAIFCRHFCCRCTEVQRSLTTLWHNFAHPPILGSSHPSRRSRGRLLTLDCELPSLRDEVPTGPDRASVAAKSGSAPLIAELMCCPSPLARSLFVKYFQMMRCGGHR